MGIQERKERERRKMEKLILDTAYQLFLQNGIDQISIRNIANGIEYSPATIYLYYNDKEAIIKNLRHLFIEDFLKKLKEFEFIKDHYGRLKNLSHSWLEYAIDNRDKYEIIYMKNGKLTDDPVFKHIFETVQLCIQSNQLQRMPVTEATTMIISFLHGVATLSINKKIDTHTKQELKEYTGGMITRFLNNFKGSVI